MVIEKKFTAGPWKTFEHSWSDTSVEDGKGKRICLLSIYSEATEKTQNKLEVRMAANSALIAASPEMFDMLQEVRGVLDEYDWNAELVGRIDALLEKATTVTP